MTRVVPPVSPAVPVSEGESVVPVESPAVGAAELSAPPPGLIRTVNGGFPVLAPPNSTRTLTNPPAPAELPVDDGLYNVPSDVEWVQSRLVELGHLERSAFVPGEMNGATLQAISGIQSAIGLEPDQVISPDRRTYRALAVGVDDPPSLQAPIRPHPAVELSAAVHAVYNLPEDVAWVRERLAFHSRDDGTPFLTDGGDLFAAMREFQIDRNIPLGRTVIASPNRSTARALAEGGPPRELSAPVREPYQVDGEFNVEADVLATQRALVADGSLEVGSYTPGEVDVATSNAIRHFQHHFMASPDGRVDVGGTMEFFLSSTPSEWLSRDLGARNRFAVERADDAPVTALLHDPLNPRDGATPVPPAELRSIIAAAAPELIERAPGLFSNGGDEQAQLEDVLVQLYSTGWIESEFREDAQAGSYEGVFQISERQFYDYFERHYGEAHGRDFDNTADQAVAAAGITGEKASRFAEDFGEQPTHEELYILHQQGEIGLRLHEARPGRPAWENMNMAGMLQPMSPAERERQLNAWLNDAETPWFSGEGIDSELDVQALFAQLVRLPQITHRNDYVTPRHPGDSWGESAIRGNLSRRQRGFLGLPHVHEITGANMIDAWTRGVQQVERFYREAAESGALAH
ncbi:MAG: hypothetical protein AAF654_11110 [Myxococcota bacterium]